MTIARHALWAALLCTIPLAVLAAGYAVPFSDSGRIDHEALKNCLRGFWTTQAIVLVLLGLWFTADVGWREVAFALALFILLPMPLVSMFWLAGTVNLDWLLLVLLSLFAGALLLVVAGGLADYAIRQPSAKLITNTVMLFIFCLAAIATTTLWIPWKSL